MPAEGSAEQVSNQICVAQALLPVRILQSYLNRWRKCGLQNRTTPPRRMAVLATRLYLRAVKADARRPNLSGGTKMKRSLFLLLVLAATILFAIRADAHHSFGATYLEDKTITLDGALVQMLFRNPHSYVQVDIKDASGLVVRWNVEWGGVV